ncbi:MAG: YfcE family phosphodiesterase [Candidatus Delongbacteria bacterium]|nr:YfcE family phosphodiesterase [Candidatus Delongbacteria bacterium]
MKIVVMSDTHFSRNFSLGAELLGELDDCSLIIHCGDFVSREFYDFLNSTGKLKAVRGNNDHSLSDILPSELKFSFSGHDFAVTHGHLISKSRLHLKYPDSDIIIFGHDHHPSIEYFEKMMILSPGSVTHNRYVDYNSFMTVSIENDQKPVVEIIKIH